MKTSVCFFRIALVIGFLLNIHLLSAQMSMPGMAAMENSVGYISSGTSVEPATASEAEPMIHRTIGNWSAMFHATGFIADTQQSGPRGRDKFYSINWFMPMVTRDFGRKTITFRTMFSLEPATVTNRRYPELFQSGETAYGRAIVDGQHPHDLFMELAARYDFRLGERKRVYAYGGPIGEPALGPTAYPHRASASENPSAVLGHHQEDSTHVSNNVITLGVDAGRIQLEASTFHGREPNENRWNIDGGKPDSFSSRITAGIKKTLTAQFSVGRINNREALHPTEDTFRMTASAEHVLMFSSGHIATSLIWGRNKDLPGDESPRIFNSYTFESTVNFYNKNWIWTRIENVDRDRTLLVGEVPGPDVEEDPIGRVQAYTFGYERDVPIGLSFVKAGFGIQATTYGVPTQLKAVYGNHPAAFTVFFHLRPTGNAAQHMHMMHQH